MTTPATLLLVHPPAADLSSIVDEIERAAGPVQVSCATDAEAVRRIFAGQVPDIAVVLPGCPDFEAGEVLTRLRAHHSSLPVILVVDHAGEVASAQSLVAGASDPVLGSDLQRLGPAVLRELRRSRALEKPAPPSPVDVRESRLFRTFEKAPVGMSHLDREERFLAVNEAFCRILECEAEDLLGRSFTEITHPADLAASAAARDAMLRGDCDDIQLEKRYRRKDGSYLWATLSVRAVRTDEGKFDFFITVIEDYSHRKAAEEALRKSEARYRALIETVHDGVWVIDSSGHTIFANPKFSQMVGYSTLALPGTAAATISPAAMDIVARMTDASSRMDRYTDEISFLTRSGANLRAVVSASVVAGDIGSSVLLTVMDVTARRGIEEQLLKRDIQLREAQDLALIGSWEFDLTTKRRETSENVARILGVPASSIDSGFASILAMTHPGDRDAVMTANMRAIKDLEPVDLDFRIIRPDGEERVVYSRAKVLADESGRATKIIGILQDITERRGTQLELQRRARQQATIAMLGQLALAGSGWRLLVNELTLALRETLDADLSEVLRNDGSAGFTVLAAAGGWSLKTGAVMPLDPPSPASFALRTGIPVIIENAATETRFQMPLHLIRSGVVSGLIVTIAGGESGAFGLLGAYFHSSRSITPEDLNFLRACANIVAECVHRELVESSLREQASREAAIAELARRIVVSRESNKVVPVSDLIGTNLHVEFAKFLRLSADGSSFHVEEGDLWNPQNRSFPVINSHCGQAVEQRKAVVVDDYRESHPFNTARFTDFDIVSGVVAPVIGSSQVLGAVGAFTRSSRKFSSADVRFLEAVADLVAEGMERTQMEHELRESQAQYRDVVEGAPAVIATLAPDRTVRTVNRAFEQITGWTAAEWIGRDFIEVLVPSHQARAKLFFAAIAAGKEITPGELKLRTKSGEIRRFELSVSPRWGEGRLIKIYGFGHDVTERRRAEADRLRIARELELILDAAGEGIYGIDIDGRCTTVNRAAASILGYTPQELAGAPMHDLIHSRPIPGNAPHICQISQTIATGARVRVASDIFYAKDGRPVPVEYSASPIVDRGLVRGAVICFSDTSGRQLLENQLEQARRLTSLGKLAATVAHEFNNVLMGISPFAQLMRRETEGTNKRLFDSTTHILNALKRGKRITEEILRFTNPAQPTVVAIDVAEWLRSIEVEVRGVIGDSYELVVSPPHSNLTVLGDVTQLHQILTNLALNARDAMPGGGRLTIAANRPAEGQSFPFGVIPQPERFVHVSIGDNGAGIAPDVLPHIFEPLFTTKKAGTGLGLAVTHQVISRHEGAVFVESVVGTGTTFHLFLPASDEVVSRVDETPTERPRLESRRILLVEDDPTVAAGIEAALSIEGLDITHAETGQEGINAIRAGSFDAAIIDVGLPDMPGTRVYDEAVADHRLPVIFSTGHADKSKLAQYLVHGNVALLKPYSIEVLLETLVQILEAQRSS